MCFKNMICDAASYDLDRSITAKMGISKNGMPIKVVSMHRSCSTPLWKVALVVLGAALTVAMICHLCKKHSCSEECE